jgi:hypothetical protein
MVLTETGINMVEFIDYSEDRLISSFCFGYRKCSHSTSIVAGNSMPWDVHENSFVLKIGLITKYGCLLVWGYVREFKVNL